ncbi:unnamed protein product [Lymnaea stagnalis]|uniref:Cellulase n=1 Tax=Lymnaea stagnalis TaxID=6523 RepID=A0AAV2I1G1_LYMST
MRISVACLMLFFIGVWGEQKCTRDGNGVLRYNGRPCASTTRYDDGRRGACGCGPRNSDTPFGWNLADYVTAPSQNFFRGDNLWCGAACGSCVKLTPTGGFVPWEGRAPRNTNSVTFMVTNVCPVVGNWKWCSSRNSYGYDVHFDLQNNIGQISNGLGWDNVEVTWENVPCSQDQINKYRQCECR